MADLEDDSNPEEGQRKREREMHRAELGAVRSAFEAGGEAVPPAAEDPDDAVRTEYLLVRLRAEMRSLDRRQRTTARFAGALAVCFVAGAVALVLLVFPRFEAPYLHDEISARSIRADRIAVTGDLRLLDAAGNELALLGREHRAVGASHAEGPVVLALNAEGDPSRQLLRLVASKTGAGLTINAPAGSSSVSLLSMQSGSTVEVRNGEQTQRLAGDSVGELAPVGSDRKMPGTTTSAAGAEPAWTPLHREPPPGKLPEVREVGSGFLLAGLSAHPAAGGMEVSGRMVNTTAVVHSGLAFRITLGGASATLTVPKISPGNSTGFRVTVPGAVSGPVGDARVDYLGSTVAFQATSTEPTYGRHVEPNQPRSVSRAED